MVVLIRKTNVLVLALAVALSAFAWYLVRQTQAIPTAAVPATDKVIVLDAGHGAPDGGAVGSSGVLEKDVNLAITQKVQALLERTGAVVLLTRADDNAIADNMDAKIRDIKRSDLKNRKNYRDSDGVDIFVSIHMNQFEQQQYHGAQVFYAGPEQAKLLGESLQRELISIADPGNTRVAKPADKSIYILKDSQIPAVIVECGFLSNPAEEQKLQTAAYQDKIAWSIYSGILKYFDQIEGGS